MKTFITGVLLALSLTAHAGTIRGRVSHAATGEPLPGVNVTLRGTLRGVVTDEHGIFQIVNIPAGDRALTFSIIGFERQTRTVTLLDDGNPVQLDVSLTPVAIQTPDVIVTANKREQSLQEVPVSVAVMDASRISLRNSVTLDDAIRYIPGVNMTEFQVNIRGSSGYSRGAGSRVLMLVDGIPLLTGDTGELNFETIPIGQVERIEVVKGANSALYGSSALGGVINVLTRPIGELSETKVRAFGGFYDSPSYRQWDWKGGTRFLDGLAVSHTDRFDKLGLVVHGSRVADDGYRQNDFRRRYNGFLKLKYDLTAYNSLTTTFNILHQRRGSFLYWKDLRNALVPPDVQQGDRVQSTRFFWAGQYNHVVSQDFIVNGKALWFRNRWEDTIDTLSNNSRSDVMRTEVQSTWAPVQGHVLTFGAEGSLERVDADLFGRRTGGGVAMYLQDELALHERIKVTLGARYDFHDLDSLSSNSQLNPKIGLVYTPGEGTAIRASFGRGFRAPSSAEAFITTYAGGIEIIPNPSLRPERSYSYEIGVAQTVGGFALVDVALFHSDYDNLIEPLFVTVQSQLKGQFNNVTRARVQGIEIGTKLGLFEGKMIFDAGYTYVNPTDRTDNGVLKYRPRHLLYVSLMGRAGVFHAGADFRYISRIERIDEEFTAFVNDAEERVPVYVTDLRCGVDLHGVPLTAIFNIRNVFQYNYVELIGNLAPPRTYVLTIETRL